MLLLRTTRKAGWNTKEWCFRAPRTCQVRLNFMGRHHGGKGTYENWANILNCHFPLSDISWGKYLLIIGSGLEDNLRKTERNGTFNNLMRLEKQKTEVGDWQCCQDLRILDPREKGGVEKWAWNPVSFKAFAEFIWCMRAEEESRISYSVLLLWRQKLECRESKFERP